MLHSPYMRGLKGACRTDQGAWCDYSVPRHAGVEKSLDKTRLVNLGVPAWRGLK
jgi:hypothetical protein